MAMTLLSKIIVDILEKDVGAMRDGFHGIVHDHQRGEFRNPSDYGVAIELFRAMADDVAPMPSDLCKMLVMPPGSTYARGADTWIMNAMQSAGPESAQRHSVRQLQAALFRVGWVSKQ